jgi:hypothetical protein
MGQFGPTMGERLIIAAELEARRARFRRKIFVTCAVVIAVAALKYIIL